MAMENLNLLHVEVALNPISELSPAEALQFLYEAIGKLESPVRDFHVSESNKEFFSTHVHSIKFCSTSTTYKTVRWSDLASPNSQPYVTSLHNDGYEFPIHASNRRSKIEYHIFRLNQGGPMTELVPDLQIANSTSYFQHWVLPSQVLYNQWDSLIFKPDVKPRLINYIKTAISYTAKMVNSCLIPSNRNILLHGPPGTGKTSLCKALAHKATIRLTSHFSQGHLFEINCRWLFSKLYSDSEKLIVTVFQKLDELAQNPLVIIFLLINEVEAFAQCRNSALMCTSESCYCTRTVDIFLNQINRIQAHSNVVTMTTANTSKNLGLNFVDRADRKIFVGNLLEEIVYEILASSINEMIRVGFIVSDRNDFLPSNLNNTSQTSNEAQHLAKIAKFCLNTKGSALRQIPIQTHSDYFMDADGISLRDFLAAMEEAVKCENGRNVHPLENNINVGENFVPTLPQAAVGFQAGAGTSSCGPNSASSCVLSGGNSAPVSHPTNPHNINVNDDSPRSLNTSHLLRRNETEMSKRPFEAEMPSKRPATITSINSDSQKTSKSCEETIQSITSNVNVTYQDLLNLTGTNAGDIQETVPSSNLLLDSGDSRHIDNSVGVRNNLSSSNNGSSTAAIPLSCVTTKSIATTSATDKFNSAFPDDSLDFLKVPIKTECSEIAPKLTSKKKRRKKHSDGRAKGAVLMPMPIMLPKIEPGILADRRILPQSLSHKARKHSKRNKDNIKRDNNVSGSQIASSLNNNQLSPLKLTSVNNFNQHNSTDIPQSIQSQPAAASVPVPSLSFSCNNNEFIQLLAEQPVDLYNEVDVMDEDELPDIPYSSFETVSTVWGNRETLTVPAPAPVNTPFPSINCNPIYNSYSISNSVFSTSESTAVPSKKKRPIKCNLCNVSFYFEKEMKIHHRQSHTTSFYKCQKCQKVFAKAIYLRKHEQRPNCKTPFSYFNEQRNGQQQQEEEEASAPATEVEEQNWVTEDEQPQQPADKSKSDDDIKILSENITQIKNKCISDDSKRTKKSKSTWGKFLEVVGLSKQRKKERQKNPNGDDHDNHGSSTNIRRNGISERTEAPPTSDESTSPNSSQEIETTDTSNGTIPSSSTASCPQNEDKRLLLVKHSENTNAVKAGETHKEIKLFLPLLSP